MALSASQFFAADTAVRLFSEWMAKALDAYANAQPLPAFEPSFTIPATFPDSEHATIAALVKTYLAAIYVLPAPTWANPVLNTHAADSSLVSSVTISLV